jgi:uncharacterized protein YecE (DUF72 family)
MNPAIGSREVTGSRSQASHERAGLTTAPRIGAAGWSLPRTISGAFPTVGTHLERYAAILPAVEINSTFHRTHRRQVFERWAASTPEAFRFSVKVPKEISHVRRLVSVNEPLEAFAEQVGGLGGRLGVVLLQMPPTLAFDAPVSSGFLAQLRRQFGSEMGLVCEPRHPTWFSDVAEACLMDHRVARAAADPMLVQGGARPGGWTGLQYHRLHGSPRVYYSSYGKLRLGRLANALAAAAAAETWCIFDNTASGAATANALELQSMMTSA